MGCSPSKQQLLELQREQYEELRRRQSARLATIAEELERKQGEQIERGIRRYRLERLEAERENLQQEQHQQKEQYEELRRRQSVRLVSIAKELELKQREQIEKGINRYRLDAERGKLQQEQQQRIREEQQLKEQYEELCRRHSARLASITKELEQKQKEQIEKCIRQYGEARLKAERRKPQQQQQQQRKRKEEQQQTLNRLGLSQHKVIRNLQLLNDLRKAFGMDLLESYPSKPYEETCLDESSMEYLDIYWRFMQSNKPCFTITKINKIYNTFHILQYRLMINKYQNVYGDYGQEVSMYHGTRTSNLNGICTYNFDRSKVYTHRFGFGTCFARDSYYATHYPQNNKSSPNKVMVMAKVYYGKVKKGDKSTTIPGEPCYTSTNDQGSVIVKHDDATAYPAYIIYYTGLHPNQPKKKK